MKTLTFWQRFWHRIAGHTFKTDQWLEECPVCGVRQGDWIYFGEMP